MSSSLEQFSDVKNFNLAKFSSLAKVVNKLVLSLCKISIHPYKYFMEEIVLNMK